MIRVNGKNGFLLVLMLSALSPNALAASKSVPTDYKTIQAAVDALVANPSLGDTIVIEVGNYAENVVVSGASNLTIEGAETARCTLQSATGGTALTISASSKVAVRNLTWTDSAQGIQVDSSNDISLGNNVFDLGDAATAVRVADLSAVEVINNSFYRNQIGVSRASEAVLVRNNIFSGNALAIETLLAANIDHNCFYTNQDDGERGANAVSGEDPRFVASAIGDFHLKPGSPCIDQGSGTDGIDGSPADMGAYGGPDADIKPFPVQDVVVTDVSAATGNPALQVDWSANGAYLVSDATDPGGYRLYYDSDTSGPPYDGRNAAGGTESSPIDVGNVTRYTLDNLLPDTTLPSAPVLATPEPANEALKLAWNAVDGATSYKLYYGVTAIDEQVVALGNATQYTLHGLGNGVSYRVSVTAVAQTRYYLAVTAYDNTGTSDHVSAYSSEQSIVLGDARESALSNERNAMPEAVVPYPVLPNEGCFIATAAFGYYSAIQVQVLRDFRDRYLLTNAPGRAFVQSYYRYGPRFARLMNAHPASKPVVRVLLYPLIIFAALCLHAPAWALLLLLLTGGLLALAVYRYSRMATTRLLRAGK